jgi:hypothetical protein
MGFFTKLLPIGHELDSSIQESNIKQGTDIKKEFKECFYAYEQRAQRMKAARLKHEHTSLADKLLDLLANSKEHSDDELYMVAPAYIHDESQYEFNRWFKLPIVPQEIEPLAFWKAKQYDFPILAEIARDHLAIPATLAPSECVFSTGGDIVTKKRNILAPNTVRYIICLRDWSVVTEEEEEVLE